MYWDYRLFSLDYQGNRPQEVYWLILDHLASEWFEPRSKSWNCFTFPCCLLIRSSHLKWVKEGICKSWIINTQLLFLVPPKIQRGPKHLKVQVGQRVDIPCNAQGTPLPVITWSKGGSTMLVDGVQHVSNPDGTLSIDQAMPSDAGIYTCVATNIAGTDETEITLHVQGDFWHRKIYVYGVGSEGKALELNRLSWIILNYFRKSSI